jgi:hypothetical protein
MSTRTSEKFVFTRAIVAIFVLALTQSSHADSLFAVTTNGIKELNPNTGALLNSFPTPIPPSSFGGNGLAYSGAVLYYSTFNFSTIQMLNPATGALLGSLPFGNCEALGYGASSFGNTLFALDGMANRLFLINPLSGSPFTSYLVGFDAAGGMDYDTARGSLFVADTAGTIREINPNSGALLNTFATGAFQTGLGFVGGRLFTSAQFGTTIEERDPLTGAILNSFSSPGGFAGGLAGSPVPEPAVFALIGVSLAALITTRRHRTGRRWVRPSCPKRAMEPGTRRGHFRA